jgi:ketosteroid isomerase-like protein
MVNTKNLFTAGAAFILFIGSVNAQTRDRLRVASQLKPAAAVEDQCVLNGTYRIDVAESDGLYAVVKNAKSSVPFADQQQFFMDLSTRLTPPDMLAIECRGRRVSVGSSRASKMTYVADGKNRRERLAGGGFVNSKITLDNESLTFVSVGDVEDNVNVAFEALDGGKRMSVTRRIYAKQLPEPIIIQTFYDRISPSVEWKLYDGSLVAENAAASQARVVNRPDNSVRRKGADTLRDEFASWLDATNRRDINKQMRFYMPELKAYYLSRNTPQRAVRLEKEKVFGAARSVNIRAAEPEIVFQNDGQTAVMRFVKEYRVAERSRTRQGAVIQELRWQRTNDGWRIFSERDVRVIR